MSRVSSILIVGLVLFIMTLAIGYPGLLTADSQHFLSVARGQGELSTNYGYLIALLWPFPEQMGVLSLFMYQCFCIWLGISLLVIAYESTIGKLAYIFFLIPFFPGVINNLCFVTSDSILTCHLVLLSGIICLKFMVGLRYTKILKVLTIIVVALAFFSRNNVIFALIPLIVIIFQNNKRKCLFVMMILIGMVGTNKFLIKTLDVYE